MLNLDSKRFDSLKDCEFWCNECDNRIVNSNDPKTGHFYMVFGQRYEPSCKVKDYCTPNAIKESVSVVFALCPECEK